ncbi:hypothetical protein H3Z83_07630 [Tenacibaculum sp. S7007]|uniref:Uncharacterized protein n=1 Tax=Tenacibaculum pelagium TaxID=2759527 RepID=A0A839AMQ2_9FLAO|nr:hypothetical protein [Tenacibaculum pelagium]MBA6156382.1 hypothetical protein [Tenacibaculum pelagium]
MKKSILNLGKALNKVEQKQINGGTDPISGDGGGSGGGSGDSGNWGVCREYGKFGGFWVRTHCDDLCSNGTQPICAL